MDAFLKMRRPDGGADELGLKARRARARGERDARGARPVFRARLRLLSLPSPRSARARARARALSLSLAPSALLPSALPLSVFRARARARALSLSFWREKAFPTTQHE